MNEIEGQSMAIYKSGFSAFQFVIRNSSILERSIQFPSSFSKVPSLFS